PTLTPTGPRAPSGTWSSVRSWPSWTASETPCGDAPASSCPAGRSGVGQRAMRVAVTGATGNVGTSVLTALAEEPEVSSVVGIARRRPATPFPKVEWQTADVTSDDLTPFFKGADAVVHLAWVVEPNHDPM